LRHCRQQALTCSGIAAILSINSVRGSAAQSESMLQFRLIFMNVLSNNTATHCSIWL
jgi:hypothetical protein